MPLTKVYLSEIVKSNITNIITGLQWFGAATRATATYNEGLRTEIGIGIGPLQRMWIKNPAELRIDLETILGYSDTLTTGNGFDLYQYIAGLINAEGIMFPNENQAVLDSISINFNAGQVMTGTFSYIVHKPTDALMEWFDTYNANTSIPDGTGEQLSAVSTDECGVYINNVFIEGVSNLNIQLSLGMSRIDTIYKRYGYIPRLPIDINTSFSLYNNYVVQNQSIFRELNNLQSFKIWKINLLKPRIISVDQPNSTGIFRNWNVVMLAKNLIKEI
jgi:hypothetical protein